MNISNKKVRAEWTKDDEIKYLIFLLICKQKCDN